MQTNAGKCGGEEGLGAGTWAGGGGGVTKWAQSFQAPVGPMTDMQRGVVGGGGGGGGDRRLDGGKVGGVHTLGED